MNPDQLNQDQLRQGLALYTNGNIHEALWQFFEALDTEPKDLLGHYLCGLAFGALGYESEARAEWQNVLDLTLWQAAAATTLGESTTPEPAARWAQKMAFHLLQQTAPKGGHFR
jgi:Flp pilus assembly protein TadD